MPAVARPGTRLALVLAVAVALVAGAGLPPAASAAGDHDRTALLRMLNDTRARHDLDPVGLDRPLSRDAKKHTNKMIRQDRLFHPADLEKMLRGSAYERFAAVAVACAGTLRGLHRALLQSRVHREILLHEDAEMVGIGVVQTDSANRCGRGSFWATYVFYG
jgi:uncharacterized protein YkwD